MRDLAFTTVTLDRKKTFVCNVWFCLFLQHFEPDLERCVDDFVMMCFFVGNDFLPHLPSLSIHKGSIDQMILLYQKVPQLLSCCLIRSIGCYVV